MRAVFLVFILFVVGCGQTTVGGLTDEERALMSPQHYVYAARLDYNRMLGVVEKYASQPPCTNVEVVACSEDRVIEVSLGILKEADTALDEAEVIVRAGGATPEAKLATSRAAIAKLTAYLVAKEIVK